MLLIHEIIRPYNFNSDYFLSEKQSMVQLTEKTIIINIKFRNNEGLYYITCDKVCNNIPTGCDPNYDIHKIIDINKPEMGCVFETNHIKKFDF